MFKNKKKLIIISSIFLGSITTLTIVGCNNTNGSANENKPIDTSEKPFLRTNIEFIKNNNIITRWYKKENSDVYYEMLTNQKTPVFVYNQRLRIGVNKYYRRQLEIEKSTITNQQLNEYATLINSYSDYVNKFVNSDLYTKTETSLADQQLAKLEARIKTIDFSKQTLLMIKLKVEQFNPGFNSYEKEGFNIVDFEFKPKSANNKKNIFNIKYENTVIKYLNTEEKTINGNHYRAKTFFILIDKLTSLNDTEIHLSTI